MFGHPVSDWIVLIVFSTWTALFILGVLLDEGQSDQDSSSSPSAGFYGSERLSDAYRTDRVGRRRTQRTYRVNRFGEIFEED